MNFNFDELSKLAKTDPEMFELRRNQLIQTEISKAPEHLQEGLLRMQKQLDQTRASTDSFSFIKYCMTQVSENLENLEDQWRCIKVTAEKLK